MSTLQCIAKHHFRHLAAARSWLASLPALLGVLGTLCVPSETTAQPLNPALCPAGSTFNPNPPGMAPFLPGMAGIPLLRHTLDPASYPQARCNDGSPAIMYIRPANAAVGGNPIVMPSSKWLIFLDGGGGCRSADDCLLTRWCGGGGRVFDRAGKMSSRGTPPAIQSPGGIFELTPPGGLVNQFADYNHVIVHYCSSDNWIGSSQHRGLSTSTGIGYDIRFQGEAIVNAVIDTLLSGPTMADPIPAERFYSTSLPSLAKATQVLIAGESAGAGGVRHHLDRLHDQLLLVAPQIDVKGVLDAGFSPDWSDSGISWADPYSPGDYRDNLLSIYEPVVRSFWGADDTALDSSCQLGLYQVVHDAVGSHPQVCYDTTYTQLNHITTPVFVRMDIDDFLAKDRYAQWQAFATPDDYWAAQFDQLTTFASFAPGVVGPPPLEAPLGEPGVQGPNCGKHVAIQNNAGFFADHVVGPGVFGLPFHDLLFNWVSGLGPGLNTQQIQTDNPGVFGWTSSVCF